MLASVAMRSAEEIAVGVQRHLGGAVMVAAVRIRHEAFGTLGGPLHRAAHLAGRPGDDRLLGVMIDLRTEPAADIGRHDAQLVLRDVQHEGAHQQPDHVRVLAGGIEREVAAVGVEFADRGARLHGVRDQPVVGQIELHHLAPLSRTPRRPPPCRRYASRSRCCRGHRRAPPPRRARSHRAAKPPRAGPGSR